jgi:formate hydrogenlyase subunit 4
MLDWLAIVAWTVGISVFGIASGLLFLGVDRILVARMQARIGPPLSQPFLDLLKLFTKENVVPRDAVTWLFNAAPVAALASSAVILLYLPIGSWAPVLAGQGDLILVVYLLMVPALAMVAGGFASSSPYATIGAQREMVTMMSYELPLATIAIAFAWKLNAAGAAEPFALTTIVENPIWGTVGPMGAAGCVLLLLTLLVVTPGELSRIPFDSPEAETELAGGLLVEYSGRNFGLFYAALGVKAVVMSALVIALFFPYNVSDVVALPAGIGGIVDFLFWLVKVELVVFVAASLIRISMARLRITQVVSLYWKYLGVLGLLGLALLMVDAALT